MADLLSPGVYVSELDYSEYVASSSSCVVGMVGGARRGPMGVPTLVTNQKDLVAIFGEPTEKDFGIYSALASLTEANQLYYTRVVRSGSKASAGEKGSAKVIYFAIADGEEFNGIKIVQTEESGDKFNVTVQSKTGEQLEQFTDVSTKGSGDNFIETAINGKSTYITVKVQNTGSVTSETLTLAGGVGSGSYATAGAMDKDAISFRSKYYDSDIRGAEVVISEKDDYGYFDVTITQEDTLIESWKDVTLDAKDDRYIENLINTRSKRIICTVNSTKEFKAGTLTFVGGDDGIDGITVTDIIGEHNNTGIYSFANSETITIDLLAVPGWSNPEVIRAGMAVCEERGDALYIADVPFGMTAQEVVEWTNGSGSNVHSSFDSSYGAFYYPWVKIADSYTKKNKWMPPSGYVIAQYAYSDSQGYPWFAPAGLKRGVMRKPIDLERSLGVGERNMLYGNRNIINPIVNFRGEGIIIWGQKTAQRKPSALDRVNVRRLLNYLKKTIGLSTKYFVFEQNDANAWDSWINMVEPVLRNVKEQRGLYDYKIEVSPSVDDIENNRMPVRVKVKPTKTAEFIPLDFMVMPTSASFEE